MKAFKISIFGPQGSGKGTQAERLEQELKLPIITPGNIFRQHIKEETEIGLKVKSILDSGGLVPNEITNQIIIGRLQEHDCEQGFVLDGYPRNINQAEALDQARKLTHVILIDVSDEAAKKRIVNRRMCTCGATYHLEHKKPKVEGICDKCGGTLFQRDDDTEEALAKRLKIYHEETEPVLELYKKQGIFYKVNGEQSIEAVWEELKKIIST